MDLVERHGPVRAAQLEQERRAGIRRAALRRLPWAAPLPVAPVLGLFLLGRWLHPRSVPFGRWIAVAVAASALPLLAAALELVAGYELRELSLRWDALAGWQRGVIGALVAAGALAVFGGVALAVAVSLAG